LAVEDFYAQPVDGDFRQGDIFRDTVSIWASAADPPVIRESTGKSNRTNLSLHYAGNPPRDGFRWTVKERVATEAKRGLAIVLTHDCEIENEDDERYRQVALIRPLSAVTSAEHRLVIVEGRHFGRLYLPAHPDGIFPDSYVDLRSITTLRRHGLDPARRVAGLSDFGRSVLWGKVIGYFTELSPPEGDRTPQAGT